MSSPHPFDVPDWLPPDARQHHRELVEKVQANKLNPRPTQLVLLAQALAQYDRVTTFLNQHGQVLEIRNDKGEVKTNIIAPETQLQLKLLDKIRSLLKDVGLDGTQAEEESPGRTEAQRSPAGEESGATRSRPSTAGEEGGSGRPGIDRLRARLAEAAGRQRPR